MKSEGKIRATWLQSERIAVFGVFSAYHDEDSGNASSRLDGCDRIHAASITFCASMLSVLSRKGVKMVLCDGCTLLCAPFIEAAERAGYEVVALEIASSRGMAAKRKTKREAAEPSAQPQAVVRNRWLATVGPRLLVVLENFFECIYCLQSSISARFGIDRSLESLIEESHLRRNCNSR